MRSLLLVRKAALLVVACSGWLLLATLVVVKADDNNNELQQYGINQGACFRMKIANDNDDDGNSYFYNGAYRAQYTRYIAFNLCNKQQDNNEDCHLYVSELDTYLESAVEYVQNVCQFCAQTCRRRRRNSRLLRFLEDEEQDEDDNNNNNNNNYNNINCDTCVDECTLLNNNNNNNDDNMLDESQYLECQASDYNNNDENNDDDLEYYTAPQCENGQVVIGHFYDEDCTIKTSTVQDRGFSYRTFETLENYMQIDCSVGVDACNNLFDDAILCEENNNNNGDDGEDAKLCRAAQSASKVYTYYKKPWHKKIPIGFILGLFFVLGFIFGCLSYTYYTRHHYMEHQTTSAEGGGKVPLADMDHSGGGGGGSTTTPSEQQQPPNNLPPIS